MIDLKEDTIKLLKKVIEKIEKGEVDEEEMAYLQYLLIKQKGHGKF